MIGSICAIESGQQYTMDVKFHDAASRPFHFTDYNKYTLAALGSVGAAFASNATSSSNSSVYYRPFDNWGSKNDWSVQLPDGENAICKL